MKRFALTRLAERDLDELKRYLATAAGPEMTRRVMRELREAMAFLGREPQAGHSREDLTERAIKFWPVYSYLVVYDPETNPVQILRLLDGRRDVEVILNYKRPGTPILLPERDPVSLFHRETRRTFRGVRPSLQRSSRAY